MKIIDDDKIKNELESDLDTSENRVSEILSKGRELRGLNYHEALILLGVKDDELENRILETAKYVKNEIYGNRLVLFAPLYISNLCSNDCLYCAFRTANKGLVRRALSQDEIKNETRALISQGHKRLLLVAGESYGSDGLDYILRSIETVYGVHEPQGNIRRINVNIAPLSIEEFGRLNEAQIGTYQIFQETYHFDTYKKLHQRGPKSDYDYRLEAIDRAFAAGFHDVGIGVLFGLQNWRYEVLALLSHIKHLEDKYGLGPHTISVPRIEPATGSALSYNPPYPVSDDDFKRIIAVLRIAVPYTGIILSTRESAKTRRECFELGISQISAGSRTNPGGYGEKSKTKGMEEQFSLGDTRPMMEVIRDMIDARHIPSFCTGCYRLGRVGKDFMELAKPGLIKSYCLPNAIFTFAEYIHDFGDEDIKNRGLALIDEMIANEILPEKKQAVLDTLKNIKNGKRDLYF